MITVRHPRHAPVHAGILFLFLGAFAAPAAAQFAADTVRHAGVPQAVNVDAPQDLLCELRFLLRDGRIIVSDRNSVAHAGQSLLFNGTLRNLEVPKTSVASITEIPGRYHFRNAATLCGYAAAVFCLSPSGTPGMYIGSIRESSWSYYYGYGERGAFMFPGVSAYSVAGVASAAMIGGLLAHTLRSDERTTLLDGQESDAYWDGVTDGASRFRLHGLASMVISGSQSAWRDAHAPYDIVDQPAVQTNSYTVHPVMTRVNMTRLLRLGYEINPVWEVGAAFQAEAVQRFHQQFTYSRPAVPPQVYVRQFSQSAALNTLCAYAQRRLGVIPSLHARLTGGAALGLSSVTATGYGYDAYEAERQLTSATKPAALVFLSAEYVLDRTLSVGLTIDASYAGSITIPRHTFYDYDSRAVLTLNEFDVPLSSMGIGLGFSMGL